MLAAKDAKTNVTQILSNRIKRITVKKYLLLCFVWMCINTGCKKQTEAVSPDHIVFSLNDSLPATCPVKVRNPDIEYVGNPTVSWKSIGTDSLKREKQT